MDFEEHVIGHKARGNEQPKAHTMTLLTDCKKNSSQNTKMFSHSAHCENMLTTFNVKSFYHSIIIHSTQTSTAIQSR